MPYLGILSLNFKKLLSYLKLAPSNLSKNEFLTHAATFGTGTTFSKDPGSAFSQGPGPSRVRFIKYALFV